MRLPPLDTLGEDVADTDQVMDAVGDSVVLVECVLLTVPVAL